VIIAKAQSQPTKDFLIQEGKVGKLEIDMSIDKIKEIFKPDQIKIENKKGEGNDYSIYKLFVDGDKKVSLELETICVDVCVIARILVYSEKYKTDKNIGVGNTLAELKSKYTITTITGGEDGIIVYIDEMSQVGFVVKIPGIASFPGKKFDKTVLNDTLKIESIYMY